MLTLLLTRPEAQSRAFAAAVAEAVPGRFRFLVSPLLAIRHRPDPVAPGGAALLAFTSANAVEAFAGRSPDRTPRAFCVGASTAAAARAAGFAVSVAEGDAGALARLIAAESTGPVLHLRGAHAAADLAALLPGRAVQDQIVYDQVPLPPTPEADAIGRAGGIDAIAVFSPRSARLLAKAARSWDLRRTATVAISAAADAPLGPLAIRRRLVADTPSRAAIIAALARL